MKVLEEGPLRAACMALVREALWQTPAPRSHRDIVDVSQIENTFQGYFQLATLEADSLVQHGLDPNIVTRIIRFLATDYAISSMKDDLGWFAWTLDALVFLTITLGQPTLEPFAFKDDLEEAILGSRRAAVDR